MTDNGPLNDKPSINSILTEMVSWTRRVRWLDVWDARNLIRLFEAMAVLEAEDKRSWTRIWYVTVYPEFYTNIGCALLAGGEVNEAEKCLWGSFKPGLESMVEAGAAMWTACGCHDLAEEAMQESIVSEPRPMRLALLLAAKGHVDTALSFIRAAIREDKVPRNRGRYCYALYQVMRLAGRKRDARRLRRLLRVPPLCLCKLRDRPVPPSGYGRGVFLRFG